MDLSVVLSTFGLIFLAELGDKTQLTAMALAARYPWKRIFLGAAAAFFVLNVAAVGIGRVLFELVPLPWIQIASGLLFLFFGVNTLRTAGDEDGADESLGKAARGPATTAFVLILLAELGDKTQLVTASLAAQHSSPYAVFIGSTLALWAVSLIGVLIGGQLTRFLPLHVVRRVAGVLFLAFAVGILIQALRGLGVFG